MEENKDLIRIGQKHQELTPGVFLEKNQERLGGKLYYNIELNVQIFRRLDIRVDFSKSVNVRNASGEDLVFQTIVPPFSRALIARLLLEKGWSLKTSFKFFLLPPLIEDQRKQLSPVFESIDKEIEAIKFLKGIDLEAMPEKDLLEFLWNNRLSFVDHDFLPRYSSAFDSEDVGLEKLGFLLHWKRLPDSLLAKGKESQRKLPEDIDKAKIDPNDIVQGQLENAWLISVFSALAEHPILIRRLFLSKKLNPQGFFRVRLCCMSRWQTVIVDDFLPCLPLGGPCFARNASAEYWAAVLEKAFAKHFGGYSRLSKGEPRQALIDLTGCPAFTFPLKSEEQTAPNKTDEEKGIVSWNQLVGWKKTGYVVVCSASGLLASAEGEPLFSNHAFSIARAFECAVKGIQLVCVRDPWGLVEWKGAWSRNSPEWTPSILEMVRPEFDNQAGQFWMAWADLQTTFSSLTVCCTRQWEELRVKGRFVRSVGVDDSDLTNFGSRWYYQVEVSTKSKVIFGLHQSDQRHIGSANIHPYIDLGLVVLQRGATYKLVEQKFTACERECFLEMELEKGTYLVVPSSLGIFLSHFSPSYEFNGDFSIGNPVLVSIAKDLFDKLDSTSSDLLAFQDLVAFFRYFGLELSSEQFEAILNQFGRRGIFSGKIEGLSEQGFIKFFFSFLAEKNAEEKFEALLKLGYDKRLFSFSSEADPLSLAFTLKRECSCQLRTR